MSTKKFARITLIFGVALLLVTLLLMAPAAGPGLAQEPPTTPPFAPGEILVKFRPDVSTLGAQGSLRTEGLQPLAVSPTSNVIRVQVQPGQEWQTIADLMARGDVEVAEPNYIAYALDTFPNDTFYAQQWGLPQISAPAAWDFTTGGSEVTIAVVDTGVDLFHTEFACSEKLLPGWNFVSDNSYPMDDHGHGSHVAGIAAACADNNEGVAGLAWNARLLPVKVLDSYGNGYYSDVADGIRYAADSGARVINLSLGGPADSLILEEAVQYAYDQGSLVVAAAGNCAQGGASCGGAINPIFYPAAYSTTLAVAATETDDSWASFSEYHPYVEVAAPGVSIYSTWKNGDYTYLGGTSMATPYAAGLAALIWTMDPLRTPDEVRSLMQATADDLGALGKDDFFGYGRINARSALNSIFSIELTDASGQEIEPNSVVFIADGDTGPIPASIPFQVRTDYPSPITWTATISPSVSWLNIYPLASGQTSSDASGQFTLSPQRPEAPGQYTTNLIVTGTNETQAVIDTAGTTVQFNYVPELYQRIFPLIVKDSAP